MADQWVCSEFLKPEGPCADNSETIFLPRYARVTIIG